MEQALPVEELANQRLNVLIYSYTLLIKNLLEEGVDLEKVKKASDKAWAILGQQAAEQLKPMFGETVNIKALHQSGAMASSIHGMEISEKVTEKTIQSEYAKCPWQDAYMALDMPSDWRLCPSGHAAFTKNMYKGLNPNATFKLTKNMPSNDQICEGVTSL
ncbi:L-2-amino-thiazoline-4-carboxylic acid hydrolase [Desulfobacula sp.]|uniref:L-2-amino-thiazoline-4-carboxylic acid hydrolase n=1 Tax=Desulfobacula sp. TaxID=2593537 RepID=UPI0025C19CE8|nr:L-2-amino-thiazoline-4-carboxylic acid hydrolase [Desulfobacula sp.]MBC2704798.1 L-2-amino-thiazoline-4-carboxylic acid hydrolase [Desulfobacula sp.]